VELAKLAGKPIVPVFQETFEFPQEVGKLPRHMQELLQFQGVKLFDQSHLYMDAALSTLAETIRHAAPL
jgi:hypothetical protein